MSSVQTNTCKGTCCPRDATSDSRAKYAWFLPLKQIHPFGCLENVYDEVWIDKHLAWSALFDSKHDTNMQSICAGAQSTGVEQSAGYESPAAALRLGFVLDRSTHDRLSRLPVFLFVEIT